MIKEYLALIESEIKNQKFGAQPKSLYEPIHYIMRLGGKRLRPLLTLLAYSLYKKDVRQIVPAAVAVEAFHNFTLMHDDIMDNAPLRRGKPTVHEKWNVNTAIISGDVMLTKVYDQFLSVEPEKLKDVLTIFTACVREVCEGQQWDMEFETKQRVTESQYLAMIRQKTAVLLGFSLELGALLADAPAEERNVVREFGINVGIGFQLTDDLLDVYAEKGTFGKQIGGDIIANKKTFLLIKALENAKGVDKKELEKWLTVNAFDKRKKIAAVKQIYDRLNLAEHTRQKINFYFIKGFDSLEKSSANPMRKAELKAFAQTLIARIS
jgi:geranylgeranyl diphosphate synthase, type II